MSEIDIDGEFPENLIEADFRSCLHTQGLLFDPHSEHVKCKKCGERMTAQYALKVLMRDQQQQQREWARAKLIREEIERRTRCKCEHCGRMTGIRVNVSESDVTDLVFARKYRREKKT